MENSANWQGPLGALASLGAIAAVWAMIGFGVNGWHWNNDPPAATPSGELARPLYGNQCLMPVWASSGPGLGGRFTAQLDSGDNDQLSLTRADAARAGLDVGALWFVFPYQSVSGTGWMAHATLRELRIGGAVLRNVSASVISETTGNGMSLVGLPLLKQLNFAVRGDSCVVSW
ncbi:MAG TPA: retroviral-like aspartic protease family protein [Steroidobacteraceae bacterium]|nr:retroviral-like aspartic protease family protein [Steroidobacteraceae bacterium]